MDISHLSAWKKEILWTWVILIGFTILGPLLGKASVGGAVLFVGLLKFFAILYSFMELKNAHRFWLIVPTTIASVCLLFIASVLGK